MMMLMGTPKSPEHREALKAARNRPEVAAAIAEKLRGRVFSEEHREKLRIARRARAPLTLSAEHRERIGAYFRGRPLTDEHRAKIGARSRGRTPSPETRAKLRAARLGTTASPEAREKMSMAHKGRLFTPQHREALRDAMKNWPVLGECVYCFGPATTHDHVVPVSRGGTEEPSNIVLACLPCNNAKRARTPEEWLAAIVRSSI